MTWVGRGVCAVCARDGEPRAITPRRVLFKLCRQLRVNGSKNQIVYEQIGTDPPQIRFPIWDNRGFAKILFPPDLGLGIFPSTVPSVSRILAFLVELRGRGFLTRNTAIDASSPIFFQPFRTFSLCQGYEPSSVCAVPHPIGLGIAECLCVYLFHKHLRVRVTGSDGGVGSMTTIATSAAATRCRCATTPAPSSRTARRVASVSPLASPVGTSSRLNGPHRTRRSPAPSAALPPFLSEIPAFLANPSPGLVPAAAANTAVFTGGIKVLLKGLTWPGVINSWFLGTVRVASSRSKRPVSRPRLSRSIAIPRTWALSSARTERDDETRTTDTSDWRRNPAANHAAERAADGVTNEQISDSTATKERKRERAQEPARV